MNVTRKTYSIVLSLLLLFPFSVSSAGSIECFGEHTASGSFANLGDFAVSPGTLRAQSFTPSQSCTVTSVSVFAKKQGTPTPNTFKVAVYSDSAGDPGSLIEQGSDISSFTGVVAWATSTFAGTTVLASGTKYWVYMSSGAAFDDTNFYKLSTGVSASTAKAQAPGAGWGVDSVDYTVYVNGTSGGSTFQLWPLSLW